MKQVELISIKLEDFRGTQSLELTLDGKDTIVRGANGTGKTTILDAYLWCLTGKDSQGRTDCEIKRREEGETLPKVDASVTVVLRVDEEPWTLKRTLHEKWQKPRGATEEQFKGNETLTEVNGVPTSVTEYSQQVGALIPYDRIITLTMAGYFFTQPWQDMRTQLIEMTGVSREEIERAVVASDARFAQLLDKLTGKTLEGYRREILASKRKTRTELDGIQPRIDQTEKLKPEEGDKTALLGERAKVEYKLTKLRASERSRLDSYQAHLDERKTLLARISDLELEQERIVRKAEEERANKASKATSETDEQYNAVVKELATWEQSLSRHQDDLNATKERRDNIRALYARSLEGVDSLRLAYSRTATEQYDGTELCPTCHQPLPEERQEEARQRWHQERTARLERIARDGKESKALADSQKAEIARLTKRTEEIEASVQEATKQVLALKSQRKKLESARQAAEAVRQEQIAKLQSEPLTLPARHEEIATEIKEVRAKLEELAGRTEEQEDEETKAEIAKQEAEMSRIQKLIDDCDRRDELDKEIKRLHSVGRDLAQTLADLEAMEQVITDYSQALVQAYEGRIGELFPTLRFALFDYTQAGDRYETCIPLIGDAHYDTANTASRINAGIELHNALAKHLGLTAPLIVDNRESVTELTAHSGQVISLMVDPTAKELTTATE